ncbi:MAG: phage tail family protein [Clostridium celatum]|nr:phage tail family protein [Clostridium celatum]
MIFNKIYLNGLEILGDETCPYYSNLFNFLFDSVNTNNDSELYMDGSYPGTTKTESKSFTLVTTIKDDSNIKGALQFTHILNQKNLINLVVDIENLGEVECKVKKESITTDDFGIMTVTLKMCDPYIYNKNYKELNLEKEIEGGWKFPTSAFTVPSSWMYTEKIIGNIGEAINEGYVTVFPTFEIQGEGKSFKILNETTGEQLNLNFNLESGQTLFIDCNPNTRCVKVNGVSVISCKSGNYISLISGSNQLKVDYEGECSVNVRWREVWI